MLILKISVVLGAGLVFAAAGETGGGMRPPGDPDKAVEAEYQTLKARGTREALELFIRRHPDHPLAERARSELERMPR